MLDGNSRSITSNQHGIHDDLERTVKKHLSTEFKKPFAPFSLTTFKELKVRVELYLQVNPSHQIILDSCCGVGESTFHLAKQNPNCLVIGIDKSEHRIDKHIHHQQAELLNIEMIRGDLNDLWRLIADANWPIAHHYILYPNPWPKSKHLGRRWHGAPVFSSIPKLSKQLTVRSNWDIYIKEFQQALSITGVESKVTEYSAEQAMTPFERKYWASGQKSTQLIASF